MLIEIAMRAFEINYFSHQFLYLYDCYKKGQDEQKILHAVFPGAVVSKSINCLLLTSLNGLYHNHKSVTDGGHQVSRRFTQLTRNIKRHSGDCCAAATYERIDV
jgi:hypothetical protein